MKTLALLLVLYSKMKPLLILSSYAKNLIATLGQRVDPGTAAAGRVLGSAKWDSTDAGEVISLHTRYSSGELREIQQDSPKARKSMIICLILSFDRLSLKITDPGKETDKYS